MDGAVNRHVYPRGWFPAVGLSFRSAAGLAKANPITMLMDPEFGNPKPRPGLVSGWRGNIFTNEIILAWDGYFQKNKGLPLPQKRYLTQGDPVVSFISLSSLNHLNLLHSMKHPSLRVFTLATLLAATSLAPRASAAPLVSVGDNLDIFFKGAVTGQYNSNILSAAGGPNKKDDYVVTLSPGLEVNYGKNSTTSVNLSYREDFVRYMQNDSLNDNLANVYLTATREQGDFVLTAKGSYVQAYTNTPSAIIPTLNTILRSDVEDGNFKVLYNISPKFFTDVTFDYTQTEYQGSTGNAYQNVQQYTLPANIYYVYSPNFDFGLSYTYTQTEPQNAKNPVIPTPLSVGRTRYNNYGGVSARIKSWEKITGSVSVGVTNNQIDAAVGAPAGDDTSLGFNAKLQYDFSPKLGFFLNANRGFTTGAQGQNIESTNAGLSAHYAYSEFVSFDAVFMNYTHSEYLGNFGGGRADNTYNPSFNVNWSPTSYLQLSAGYSYYMNSSNATGATYNINLVTVSATLRY